METRFEGLLNAILNDEEYTHSPSKTKMEIYLKACIDRTGTEGLPVPVTRADTLLYLLADEMAGGDGNGTIPDDGMYLLVDKEGNEIPAVLVDDVTVFDATANDIREGKTAATDTGVTVGTKVIPSYYVTETTKIVQSGKTLSFKLPGDELYDYTKLQAIICPFNKSLSGSVSAEKVAINNSIYDVLSTVALSVISVNHDTQSIEFGIENTMGVPCVIRLFTYKEVY